MRISSRYSGCGPRRTNGLATLGRLYSDDFLGVTSNGRKVTRSDIIVMLPPARPVAAAIVSEVDIHGAADVVISAGFLTAVNFAMYTYTSGGKEGGVGDGAEARRR